MVNSPDCKVMNKTYELKLKSHIGEVRRVERFVKKMAAEQGFAESRLHDIKQLTMPFCMVTSWMVANWHGYAVRYVAMSYA